MPSAPVNRGWLWLAVSCTGLKLWLTGGQTIFAIGPAIHDDRLFVELAAHILNGEWLGPYNQFTLAKGPMFPLFIAASFWLGLPLLLTQQLFYAAACAVFTRSLTTWLRTGAAQCGLYVLLLWNPMSFDAGNLGRLMRQNVYTPLALLVFAGLVRLFARRRETWHRQVRPAALAGLALGCFWLTREESVWLLPAVGLLLLGTFASLYPERRLRWPALNASVAVLLAAALLPISTICALNYRHYGWFGTVEFRADAFKDAYGALTRLQTGPDLPQVPVTREMREAAYAVSPAFALLRPYLEGPVGDHWSEKTLFPAADRQMRGGWFIWAIRDATVQAGLAPDAGAALRYYRRIASEVNAACDDGRVPARPPRSGFLPPLNTGQLPPLAEGAMEYGSFFLFFKGFTARSPASVGDYAELKPFRDLVGTPLSPAPRSPDASRPSQSAYDLWRVELLEDIGLGLGKLIGWLGPLVLLVGCARGVECLIDRRITFPLGLAAASLAACAAYLAINVLVHVTSFYNMSPAAMASAYPLYLIALGAVVMDACSAWRRPRTAVASAFPSGPGTRWVWLAPAGAALIVFAARLAEIHRYASDVPFNDQWYIEATQIIAPWLDGTLRPWTFFTPHFEHLPLWTRLLAWVQVALTGRWDPLVQMTTNAGLHAGFIWLVGRWVWQTVSPRAAGFVTLILILGGAVPHAWENIAWGFQSQFPLALIFLVLHIRGACIHPVGSRGWWLAQGAGLAGLFTLASMWLAPLATVASLGWTKGQDRRALIPPLVLGVLGIGLLVLIHSQSPADGSFAQVVASPLDFFSSGLRLLGWPGVVPGALAIVQLPWLIHALRVRDQSDVAAFDRIIFSLGLFNCAQALALAFARSGSHGDYVSRYGDLLFVGVLAGALALTRLFPAVGRARFLFLTCAGLWTGVVIAGLVINGTEGHARYFHQTALASDELRSTAVRAYLESGDRSLLEKTETRWVLVQDPMIATRLLDRTDFRALLPSSVNPANPADAAGRFVRKLQSSWLLLLLGGVLVLAIGAGLVAWRGSTAPGLPTLAARQDNWNIRLSLAVALAAAALLFLWSNPLAFDQEYRARQLLGGKRSLTGLTFAFGGPAPFGAERLQGAAPITPIALRNQFYGTAPEGPGLTCAVVSSAFVLTKPWLVVPYAGYPVGHGNGLRLQILDDQGQTMVSEIGCNGPNLEGIAYWSVATAAHLGRKARLVLYDGRTDTEAWVAAAPPIPADSPDLATALAERLQKEKHAGMHASFGIIALISLACFVVAWRSRRWPVPAEKNN